MFNVDKAGNIITTGSLTTTGAVLSGSDVRNAPTGFFYWSGRSALTSPVNGNILMTNAAQNDFGLLMLGSTTSSYPAIKRSGATIAIRLGDDSADGGITASTGSFSDNISTTVAGKTLIIKSGSNAKSGTFTLSSGAATVANTSVTANSCIAGITIKTASGSATSLPRVATTTPGTGFTVAGTATDNGTYNYFIVEVN